MPVKAGIFYAAYDGGPKASAYPPVTFIHGAGGTHLHWPADLRRMEGLTTYSVDLPGHGQSPGEAEGSIAGYAQRMVEWMVEVGLERTVVAGHSMGGAIALTLGIHSPERVAGLILVATGAKLRVHPEILSLTSTERSYDQAVELIGKWAFSESAEIKLVELAQSRMAETPHQVVHQDFQACDQFNMMEQLHEVKSPALILCGEEDQLTPIKYGSYLADKLPTAYMETVPDAGHMVMLERPADLEKHIRGFFRTTFG